MFLRCGRHLRWDCDWSFAVVAGCAIQSGPMSTTGSVCGIPHIADGCGVREQVILCKLGYVSAFLGPLGCRLS